MGQGKIGVATERLGRHSKNRRKSQNLVHVEGGGVQAPATLNLFPQTLAERSTFSFYKVVGR